MWNNIFEWKNIKANKVLVHKITKEAPGKYMYSNWNMPSYSWRWHSSGLWHHTIQSCRQLPFRRKMEAISTSEMLVTNYKTTWHYNPKHHSPHFQCHENLQPLSTPAYTSWLKWFLQVFNCHTLGGIVW